MHVRSLFALSLCAALAGCASANASAPTPNAPKPADATDAPTAATKPDASASTPAPAPPGDTVDDVGVEVRLIVPQIAGWKVIVIEPDGHGDASHQFSIEQEGGDARFEIFAGMEDSSVAQQLAMVKSQLASNGVETGSVSGDASMGCFQVTTDDGSGAVCVRRFPVGEHFLSVHLAGKWYKGDMDSARAFALVVGQIDLVKE